MRIDAIENVIEKKKAKGAIKKREGRFCQLIENIKETFWIQDVKTNNLIYVSPNFETVWGLTTQSIKKKPERFLESIHQEDRDRASSIFKSLRIDESSELEFRIVKPDGLVRWIHTRNFPIFDGADNIYCRAGVHEDITEKKNMEERLQYFQRMESIGNMAAYVAHDFNNLLSPILGLSEVLLNYSPKDSTENAIAHKILGAGKRARELVKNLLSFVSQSDHRKVPVRIQHILKEALELNRSAIPSNIEVLQNIKADCGYVLADPTQILQIFLNLINNAYQAIGQSNGIIIIQLKETVLKADNLEDNSIQPGKYAILKISDTGSGIDPSLMDQIFEPFFTTKKKGDGTGLGLAVVKEIVKDHCGHIHVKSKYGKGTILTLYFPLIT